MPSYAQARGRYEENMNPEPQTPPTIDISVQDPVWEKLGDVESIVKTTAMKALTAAIMPRFTEGHALEVSLVLANDDLVQLLNREYRDKDKPTNVLTFASLDDEDFEKIMIVNPLNLGDVILSYQTIERECQEQGKFMLDHVRHLTVHGVLHLLGYDHQTDEDATDMETLEIRILEQLGVQNPYTDTGIGV